MRLVGRVFRAHHPGWAFDPVSGRGASLHRGRFNRPGVEALYTATRVETAWLEAQQGLPFKAQPMTICAYEVDCADMLDLTDSRDLVATGTSRDDISCPWERVVATGRIPPSWILADRLIAAGHAGLLVPSFAPGAGSDDRSAVFWRWSPDLPHRVHVIDDLARLPRDARSWT